MGVASGQFEPTTEYSVIQSECRTNHLDQSGLALSVRTEAGLVVPSLGIAILDYAEECLPDWIEIHVLGIPPAFYEELFPEHVEKYERQFR